MSALHRYRKKPSAAVVAVRLDLDTDGFTYRKWGEMQRCKARDWVVDNEGDVYTVDAETFTATYRQVSPGRYLKSAPVWAEIAETGGTIETKEGATRFEAGDYLVYNGHDRTDGWAVTADRFEEMYEPDEEGH